MVRLRPIRVATFRALRARIPGRRIVHDRAADPECRAGSPVPRGGCSGVGTRVMASPGHVQMQGASQRTQGPGPGGREVVGSRRVVKRAARSPSHRPCSGRRSRPVRDNHPSPASTARRRKSRRPSSAAHGPLPVREARWKSGSAAAIECATKSSSGWVWRVRRPKFFRQPCLERGKQPSTAAAEHDDASASGSTCCHGRPSATPATLSPSAARASRMRVGSGSIRVSDGRAYRPRIRTHHGECAKPRYRSS